MNYIILNGVRSDTIPGLLIQSLPPISKPAMRTEIEEIDGRSGDIVTPLGYAAYDREISIGLHGNFNIDSVIEYFNSEGTAIFSNEPDKLYEYRIDAQIDFERLIRFRTATVTFHVQPFKFSATEDPIEENYNYLEIPNFSQTKNGITVNVQDGDLTVVGTGTGTGGIEFYVPIQDLDFESGGGEFRLTAYAEGENPNACSIRLIKSVPSDADSFGGTFVTLQNGNTVTLTQDFVEEEEHRFYDYNYIWFWINPGTKLNFILDVSVYPNWGGFDVDVINEGNIYSKPIITIHGYGTIGVYLDNEQYFSIDLGGKKFITLDTEQMQAYKGGTLMNRFVTGNYDNFKIKVGGSKFKLTGDVTSVEIERYSRWI